MLKHHNRLKKLWSDCEVLTMISGMTMTTKAFDKELIDCLQKDIKKSNRFKDIIDILRVPDVWKLDS